MPNVLAPQGRGTTPTLHYAAEYPDPELDGEYGTLEGFNSAQLDDFLR